MAWHDLRAVVNLERLAAIYERHKIDSRSNFIYMTLTGSLLDQFAAPRGYRRIPLQLDDDHTTAGCQLSSRAAVCIRWRSQA
jgi:hypothetical protein